jgi:antitoxin component YwqK of YwqJK toxin-antitoxin module
MKNLILFFAVAFTCSAFGQVNQTDANGLKQGVWKKAWPGSTAFKYVGQFKDGKPYGKFVYYYESGAVQTILIYRNDSKTSDAQMYHESGYLMARGKYVNQKKDSIWVFYDDRGLVSAQEDYLDGQLDGQRVVFYEPREDGQYLVQEYSYWVKGKQHGEYKRYHPNTQVSEEGNYVNGNKNGKIIFYHPNGHKRKIEQYNMGVKHGYWINFDESGKQLGYKLYWEGEQLKGEALKQKEAELRANH